jgi:subtilisin family serine protease
VGWVDDEFIVVLDAPTRAEIVIGRNADSTPRVSVASLQSLLIAHGATQFRRQFRHASGQARDSGRPDLTGHYKVKLRPGASVDDALRAFRDDPHVEHVEKIGIHTVSLTPNDPYFVNSPNPDFDFDQWHYWDAHSINADLAWDITGGDEDVVVAILDTGVRYFHVDLGGDSPPWDPDNPFAGGNVFINPAEISGDGLDNDNNGFADDTIGWDFVDGAGGGGASCIDEDCDVADNDPDDYNGHGTHVAGTVAAITNNGSIVSGVAGGFAAGSLASSANGCQILPLRIGFHGRIQGQVGGAVRMDWAAEAMSYVADLVDAGVNVAAINCSWGSSNSGGLDAAVEAVLARDVIIVHAAGNSSSSTADFLGGRAGVMNVAATDVTGNGASFTNHGSWVDVAAPGVSILSVWRERSDPDPTHHYLAVSDGTSMSAPHIAGIAALMESCNSSLSGPAKFALIVNNTNPYTDPRDLGSGIADARKAVYAAGCGPVLVEVTDVAAEAKHAGILLSWKLSVDAQREVAEVLVQRAIGGSAPYVTLAELAPTEAMSFWDMNRSEIGARWYRLALVANGGSLTLSRPVQVEVTGFDWQTALDATFGGNGGPVQIRYSIGSPGHVSLEIFDVAGRRVRLLHRGFESPGDYRRTWSRVDAGGRRVGRGIYMVRLVAPDGVISRKLAIVR